MKEDTECVYPDHPVESGASMNRLAEAGNKGNDRSRKGEKPNQFAAGVLAKEGINHHDEHASDAKHQFGKDKEIVAVGNHLLSLFTAAVCSADVVGSVVCGCVVLVGCKTLRASVTAGSMERIQ